MTSEQINAMEAGLGTDHETVRATASLMLKRPGYWTRDITSAASPSKTWDGAMKCLTDSGLLYHAVLKQTTAPDACIEFTVVGNDGAVLSSHPQGPLAICRAILKLHHCS